jgi:hypothetical protein
MEYWQNAGTAGTRCLKRWRTVERQRLLCVGLECLQNCIWYGRAAMTTKADKLAAFFALLAQRQREQEARQAQERREAEDRKLARLKPWWQEP